MSLKQNETLDSAIGVPTLIWLPQARDSAHADEARKFLVLAKKEGGITR